MSGDIDTRATNDEIAFLRFHYPNVSAVRVDELHAVHAKSPGDSAWKTLLSQLEGTTIKQKSVLCLCWLFCLSLGRCVEGARRFLFVVLARSRCRVALAVSITLIRCFFCVLFLLLSL